jgi:hypothetical protein
VTLSSTPRRLSQARTRAHAAGSRVCQASTVFRESHSVAGWRRTTSVTTRAKIGGAIPQRGEGDLHLIPRPMAGCGSLLRLAPYCRARRRTSHIKPSPPVSNPIVDGSGTGVGPVVL